MVCLLLGVLLILIPWVDMPLGSWGNNYLLLLTVETTGLPFLETVITSAWVRGAVTGLGVFNIVLAFWEIANFQESVATLDGKDARPAK